MRVVVTAVPGGGKSTIMRFVRKLDPNVVIVNYGDHMFEVARREHRIRDRDDMRKLLSRAEYLRVQERAAKELSKMTGDVLIDTHASVRTPMGYYPGLPDRVVSLLSPDAILVLEFEPRDVLERRTKDIAPADEEAASTGIVRRRRAGREVESEEEVELQQQVNRCFAAAAASAARCSCKILNLRFKEKKPFEHAEVGAREILKMLRQ